MTWPVTPGSGEAVTTLAVATWAVAVWAVASCKVGEGTGLGGFGVGLTVSRTSAYFSGVGQRCLSSPPSV